MTETMTQCRTPSSRPIISGPMSGALTLALGALLLAGCDNREQKLTETIAAANAAADRAEAAAKRAEAAAKQSSTGSDETVVQDVEPEPDDAAAPEDPAPAAE